VWAAVFVLSIARAEVASEAASPAVAESFKASRLFKTTLFWELVCDTGSPSCLFIQVNCGVSLNKLN
jgi:invasion protein IalB